MLLRQLGAELGLLLVDDCSATAAAGAAPAVCGHLVTLGHVQVHAKQTRSCVQWLRLLLMMAAVQGLMVMLVKTAACDGLL